MAKYRKKPVVIDAWKWDGKFLRDAREFTQKNKLPSWPIGGKDGMTGLIIPTLEGDHVATQGDYIIKGIASEYYPCKSDIFEMTYDKIEE